MKKYILFLMCLVVISISLSACSGGGDTDDVISNGNDETLPTVENDIEKFSYSVSDYSNVTITGYTGVESTVVIPEKIQGIPVTAIAENAFRGFIQLEKLVIPDSVSTIDYAFPSCADLTYVSIGSGVTSMNGAFKDCGQLRTVVGGDSAQYMDEAFSGCSSLEEGYIPSDVKSALSAYSGCTSLKTVKIEEGITYLDKTFEGCDALTEVVIPKSVLYLVSAFADCTSLSEVRGSEKIEVYNGSFKNCVNLTELKLGDNVKELISAFCGCISLKKVENLPTMVEKYASSFTGCRSISEIIVPKISDAASLEAYSPIEDFSGCDAVTDIDILADFTVREEFCRTFSGLMSLERLNITENVAKGMLRVAYNVSDTLYEGNDKKIASAVKQCKNSSEVRFTDNYATVDGIAFTHIYGGDVYAFDPSEKAGAASVIDFEPFELVSYWCGYPTGGNRKKDTVAVERKFSFFLRTTGKNGGTIPNTVLINGYTCVVGE